MAYISSSNVFDILLNSTLFDIFYFDLSALI